MLEIGVHIPVGNSLFGPLYFDGAQALHVALSNLAFFFGIFRAELRASRKEKKEGRRRGPFYVLFKFNPKY